MYAFLRGAWQFLNEVQNIVEVRIIGVQNRQPFLNSFIPNFFTGLTKAESLTAVFKKHFTMAAQVGSSFILLLALGISYT